MSGPLISTAPTILPKFDSKGHGPTSTNASLQKPYPSAKSTPIVIAPDPKAYKPSTASAAASGHLLQAIGNLVTGPEGNRGINPYISQVTKAYSDAQAAADLLNPGPSGQRTWVRPATRAAYQLTVAGQAKLEPFVNGTSIDIGGAIPAMHKATLDFVAAVAILNPR
jgi:hypothetical protein